MKSNVKHNSTKQKIKELQSLIGESRKKGFKADVQKIKTQIKQLKEDTKDLLKRKPKLDEPQVQVQLTEEALPSTVVVKQTEEKLKKIEPNFLSVSEESITSGVAAAKAKLAAAREANDLGAEADAMAARSEFGYKKAKLTDRKSTRLNSSHRCISYAFF